MSTNLSTRTITDRITAGAAWLDHNHPNWANHIDLDDLDMANPYRCVLGQIYQPCWAAPLTEQQMQPLGFHTVTAADNHDDAKALAEPEYDALQTAWEQLITSRQGGAA